MRQIYKSRRQLLYALLRRDFSDWLEPIPSLYGTHVAAWARDGAYLDPAVQVLAGRSAKIHTLARYHLRQPPRAGFVFGYGAVDLPETERRLVELRGVLRQ